jgi:hypothetical protein
LKKIRIKNTEYAKYKKLKTRIKNVFIGGEKFRLYTKIFRSIGYNAPIMMQNNA